MNSLFQTHQTAIREYEEKLRLAEDKNKLLTQQNNFLQNMLVNMSQGKTQTTLMTANHEEAEKEDDCRILRLPKNFEYSLTWFKAGSTNVSITQFIDDIIILCHTNLHLSQPLIMSQADFALVLIILKEYGHMTKFGEIFVGTVGNFCDLINVNVLPTIKDEKLREQLECKEKTLNDAINEIKFRKTSPRKWIEMYSEKNARQKTKLGRAIDIFDKMKK